jgi:hypothetical protein
MPTPPDFTNGTALEASSLNSVGLWKVAQGPLSSTATNFVGCFTSSYTNYRLVIEGFGSSVVQYLVFQLLNNTSPDTGSNYFTAMTGITSTGAASSIPLNGGTSGYLGYNYQAGATLKHSNCSFDITAPNLAQITTLIGTSNALNLAIGGFAAWNGSSFHQGSTAFNGIRIFNLGGGTIAGNVSIYGYNKS